MMTSSLLGAVILIFDLWAILSVLMGRSPVERKILWVVIILLLPVVGLVLYLLIGRRPSDAKLV
ncbi:MAG: PLDc N-terminal domain-containing protein [Planctomycetia bacterium]|nr:PLDc N-terminal domain-containing protein [Planctomycetia bacterium]